MQSLATDLTAEFEIIRLLSSGQLVEAAAVLTRNGGATYPFYHGYESLARIIDAVPESAHLDSEVFLGAYCIFLVKEGRARRAQALLKDRRIRFKKTFLFDFFDFLVAIHLGDDLSEEQLTRWTLLEGRLPVDQPLYDGLYYNCMLVTTVRLNQMANAKEIARQALESFERANQPYLQFFIHMHLADLAIVEGNLKAARRHIRNAERFFVESGNIYGTERELIEVAWLAVDYELGRFAHIPERATQIRKALVAGDSWAEIFIQLCRIGTMSTYFTSGYRTAMDYLEDCQADFHRRHGDFSNSLDTILASLNLLDGRTEQAQYGLVFARKQGLFSAIGTTIFESTLGKIEPVPVLDLLQTGNPCLRREITTELLKASVAKSQRQSSLMRRHVETAMRLAVSEGLVSIFLEHREVVAKVSAKLATGSFARGHRQLARMARQVHNLLQASYVMPEEFSRLGITTQQLRVLTALQNGASNKQIAGNLGLSEATIKFHMRSLFKMFGVSKRGELIENIEKFVEIA